MIRLGEIVSNPGYCPTVSNVRDDNFRMGESMVLLPLPIHYSELSEDIIR